MGIYMSTSLIVEKKNVYGVERVYPVCTKAKIFAAISGNKTLLPEVIEHMKKYKNPMKAVREIREELQSILKDFHYESDTEQMSKDVVVALENLVGELK
jgi:hypothetical protein